jgi:hypothetical protein
MPTTPPVCRHCGDELPEDCPPHLTSCRAYWDWRARQAGDMLTEEESAALTTAAAGSGRCRCLRAGGDWWPV